MSGAARRDATQKSVVQVLRVARTWRFTDEVFVTVVVRSDSSVGDLVKLVCIEYPTWGTANKVALYAMPGGRARALEVEANPASAADVLVPAHKLAVDELVPDKAWLLALVPPPASERVDLTRPPPPAVSVTAALPTGAAPAYVASPSAPGVAAVAADDVVASGDDDDAGAGGTVEVVYGAGHGGAGGESPRAAVSDAAIAQDRGKTGRRAVRFTDCAGAGGAGDGRAGGASGAPPSGAAPSGLVVGGSALAPAPGLAVSSDVAAASKPQAKTSVVAATTAPAAAAAAASATAVDSPVSSATASTPTTAGGKRKASGKGKGGEHDAGASSRAEDEELADRAPETAKDARLRHFREQEAERTARAEHEKARREDEKARAMEAARAQARERLRACAYSYCRLPGRFEAGDYPANACSKGCGAAIFCTPECRTRANKEHEGACAKAKKAKADGEAALKLVAERLLASVARASARAAAHRDTAPHAFEGVFAQSLLAFGVVAGDVAQDVPAFFAIVGLWTLVIIVYLWAFTVVSYSVVTVGIHTPYSDDSFSRAPPSIR